MSYYSKSVTVDVDVDVDLDDFDEEDIVEYLEDKGYTVYKGSGGSIDNLDDRIWILYDAWKHDRGDNDKRFDKEMRKFFADYYNKVSV